jgi:hypothetical protein
MSLAYSNVFLVASALTGACILLAIWLRRPAPAASTSEVVEAAPAPAWMAGEMAQEPVGTADSTESGELARRISNTRPLEPAFADATPRDADREHHYPVRVR